MQTILERQDVEDMLTLISWHYESRLLHVGTSFPVIENRYLDSRTLTNTVELEIVSRHAIRYWTHDTSDRRRGGSHMINFKLIECSTGLFNLFDRGKRQQETNHAIRGNRLQFSNKTRLRFKCLATQTL